MIWLLHRSRLSTRVRPCAVPTHARTRQGPFGRVSPIAVKERYIVVGSSIVWDLAAVQISSHVHLEPLQLPTFEVYHLEAPGRVSIRSVLRVMYVISVQDH